MHRIVTIVTTSVAAVAAAALIVFFSINWTADMIKTILITVFVIATILAAGPPLIAQWTRHYTARDRARERVIERARTANAHLIALASHRPPQDS